MMTALRDGASFHRLTCLIGPKNLHQLFKFRAKYYHIDLQSLSAKAGSFLGSTLPLIPNTANSIRPDTTDLFCRELNPQMQSNEYSPGI